MSSATSSTNYITARELFLAHHWRRYAEFNSTEHGDFVCGRIVSKAANAIVLTGVAGENVVRGVTHASALISNWSPAGLREPRAAESAPPAAEVLAIGDWVGVSGKHGLILFAPCASRGPLPITTDVLAEGRRLVGEAQAWAEFLHEIRHFFTERLFVEMTTPTLAPSPGTEPFLDPLHVRIESNGLSIERFLITSPEFHLKKSLSAGLPRIFEIAKCFRNKEGGDHHRVEFHMHEWYRSFASLKEIAEDVEALIRVFAPDDTLVRTTMQDLFLKATEFRLESSTTRDDLATVAKRLGVRTTPDDDFDDVFHRVFLEKIEPRLGEFSNGGPLMISSYPPSMAALSRIRDDGFADRFEVYWRGLELCNAFHELNDPIENRKRFEKDNQRKEQSGRRPVPLDDELLKTFDLGMPPAGGIALGIERLFMAVHNISDIARVRPFL